MKKIKIHEDLDIVYQKNDETPRSALTLYFGVSKPPKCSGLYAIISRLMLSGTKNKSKEEISNILDINGIELSVEAKQDFLRVKALFLNEDFEKTLDMIQDILYNSTFEEFDKEIYKMRGEIASELDSPKTRAADVFLKNVFADHYYGDSYSKILECLDIVKKEDVVDSYNDYLNNSPKIFSFVGDIDQDVVVASIEARFKDLKSVPCEHCIKDVNKIEALETIKLEKDDAKQAQIYKGWIVESYKSEDYAPLVVLNNLLGSGGLSSRLFLNLRDKQGLAYVVRSSYEALKSGALFSIYIATDPKNIKKSLEGFNKEIEIIKNEKVGEAELLGAKGNVLGKYLYFTQTNVQQAGTAGYDEIMGLGFNYETRYRDMINSVGPDDIIRVANKYLNDRAVITILAPKEDLNYD